MGLHAGKPLHLFHPKYNHQRRKVQRITYQTPRLGVEVFRSILPYVPLPRGSVRVAVPLPKREARTWKSEQLVNVSG